MLRDLKRPEEALASYDQALAIKPDYAEALNNRGNALRDAQAASRRRWQSYDKALADRAGSRILHSVALPHAVTQIVRLDQAKGCGWSGEG